MAQQPVVTKNRDVPLDKIRNIGVIAHIDSGKTTTSERFLFYTGKTYKIGDIDDGDTQLDWMPQERERGITIVSAATTTFWNNTRINIIDTPGHVDFTAEVERSLRVLDGGVVVFDAEEGVQSQSETVWRQADKYKVPRICFINKMDKLGADFEATVEEIKERLGANPIIMTVPIGKESEFTGVIDLLTLKAKIWDQDPQGIKYTVTDVIPEDIKDKVTMARSKMVEQIAEHDDALLNKYLNGEEITVEELKTTLRKATIAYKIVPVYCGTSLRNKAVQPVLDAIVDFLPSPLDLKEITGINPITKLEEKRALNQQEKFTGLAFKIQLDPHVGKLTYVRIYSGILESGSYVYNVNRNKQERVSRILLMHANNREEIDKAYAGEIVAVIGPKDSKTGDTLGEQDSPIILEQINFPEPVISLAIEPTTKADQEKLSYALQRLAEEDPTFRVKVNHETNQTIMSGMGELHLEILVDRMKREMGMNVTVGKPQVAYKETITKPANDVEVKYIKQTGGHGQYGHCVINVEPLARGEGVKFVNKIKGGSIPSEFIPSVEKGVMEATEKGVLLGYPITDIQVTLVDGSYHDVDSSDIAFKIAGSMALHDAVKQAGPTLVEPIMKLEVTIPEAFMGVAIGDISSKRGKILGTEKRSRAVVIKSHVPLSELSGYATIIRSLTEGRGVFYMEPSHYEEVPKNVIALMLKR
ncbi:elongation factor G [Candidatus Roizmanbacteria bacterium CG_4_8_14_3_um_filter_34_9]|uniref:Elongation factor G n=2 Tax=Candidatus Roizmaniibacteriota TaxID=1752723 RepID=A0A2M6YSJ6_9BACT|nr:MAG: elongation factor G [Candidatus Roizmanbacteria bacterium CG07_land_8_20_14_0_80_34_15]PIW73179.1 MAG: elongation factor G [Candidatus Roizmanbacteria bacterium CG_4_8_14_3_um_filter_34_9]